MNAVLTVVLLSVVAMLGQPTVLNEATAQGARDARVLVLQVSPNSPAETAGLKSGDAILRISDEETSTDANSEEVVASYLAAREGKEITLTIRREGEEVTKTVILRSNPNPGEGALGVSLALVGTVSYPVWRAPWEGTKNTFYLSIAMGDALGQILQNVAAGKGVGESLSGPVGIATLTGDAARLGFVYLLQFTAFLSLNLAILNILPFPALDGGRLVFLLVEKIKGSPITPRVEQLTHGVGFALLLAFILWITFKDIARLL
jgi:regulator of sigma E protease